MLLASMMCCLLPSILGRLHNNWVLGRFDGRFDYFACFDTAAFECSLVSSPLSPLSLLASMAMVYLLVANIVVAPLELPYRLVLVIKKLPCRLVLAKAIFDLVRYQEAAPWCCRLVLVIKLPCR
jgi:hypothetical protein